MNNNLNGHWVHLLQAEFDQSIPLTRAIGVRVIKFDGKLLELRAPLAPNVNDKGTAFGGSISCLLTLAAWGVVWIECARANFSCDFVIHKGNITYNKPVRTDLQAVCVVPDRSEIQKFFDRLEKKGRARIRLRPELRVEGDIMTVFDCQYAALRRRD